MHTPTEHTRLGSGPRRRRCSIDRIQYFENLGSAVSGLFIYLWAIHILSGLLELDRIMEENYEVMVIGAGMSGMGASQILAEKKIGQVILEGRVGGRVAEG